MPLNSPLLINSEFLYDPYPVYAALRESAPVYWSKEFCGGAWLISRYEDVAVVLQDPRFSVQRASSWVNTSGPEAAAELLPFKRIFSRAMLFLNAPRHTRLRQVMNAGFKPGVILALAPQIEKLADQLIDNCIQIAEQSGNFDFMRDFARPLPSLVMAQMLGVNPADCPQFGRWADDIADFIGSPTPNMELARLAQTSLIALNEYFAGLLDERRKHLGDDLISLLLRAEVQGQIKTTKELLAQCSMLLFAGQETTRNLLGNGMATLLHNPEQWQLLKHDATQLSALLPTAVRELLRYESPVQYTGRRLLCDVTLQGQSMKKGDLVIALLGAANRDPLRFSNPDRLNIERKEGNHLSFGFGPHVCIGATLTMLEAEIAFRRLIFRLPTLHFDKARLQWAQNAVYRGLSALSLSISPIQKPAFGLHPPKECIESVLDETSFV